MSTQVKREKSTPKRSPAYVLFARVDPSLGERFEAYLQSVQPRPSVTRALALLVSEALAARGFGLHSKEGSHHG